MAVSATYTKDIHYSGIITVDGGRKYRANKKDIDDVVDKFENDIWDEYDKYTAELEEKEKTE